ncbi:hypothetical protein [Paenibacillus xylanexedens]|uniref:Glycosyltransferase 2-like domain-containing protein n=1 Tax=Paenibacillus xylanexedens TaxID=528191 RepID=A0ABS4RSG2_PAEXY|nr:hypothetical protein [Paenibacillus xylanexedens]MBP2245827.1 hypothetical protein [Paenibacillus xylanexedens]
MEPKLSIVVTLIERDVDDLCKLINSYLLMERINETELLIMFKTLSVENETRIQLVINNYKNIKIFVREGYSRCQRKDEGLRLSSTKMVAFVDSDCTFDRSFTNEILEISGQKVIRGRNIYIHEKNRLSRYNAIYRTLCDEIFFKNETFSPNLIFDKEFLIQAGGWSHDNLDSQDDFILSQRLKSKYDFEIYHASNAVLNCKNKADDKIKKLVKTWFGYGVGYGYRLWRDNEHILVRLKRYVPPIVYTKDNSLSYFSFSIFQWTIVLCGYIVGIFRHQSIR